MEFFNWVNKCISTFNPIGPSQTSLEFLKNNPFKPNHKYYHTHKKLCKFITKIIPTQADIIIREHIIQNLCERIKMALKAENLNSNFMVIPSGSSLNSTFLPCADIDIVLFFYPVPCNSTDIMNLLMDKLLDLTMDNKFQPIFTAKVPVLKFFVDPNIQVDISIDELQGPLNVVSVRKILEKFPILLPVQLFMKCLLRKYNLDKPYIGGINSYTLQLMLIAYIQYKGVPNNITDFIIDVCDFYGKEFNFTLTGIDTRNNGCFFSRYNENKLNMESPTTAYIIDPLNHDNILGQNAFKMIQIRKAFNDVHDMIVNGNVNELIHSFDELLSEFDELRQNIDIYTEMLNDNK